MEFTDFIVEFSEHWRDLGFRYRNHAHGVSLRGGQRMGQAMFNFLQQHRPDLADRVRNTVASPFYDDDRIPSFLAWLEGEWDRSSSPFYDDDRIPNFLAWLEGEWDRS